ncbi:diaminopimelate epimerase [uncultured Clostridium sp.]|uniref:diaminopimelate epimerase n=1 Tax=uncultured Clostridium sp. TaxID=59620 RepID=UPI00261BF879|nr:diaminopimelate epimerase [uncultured Clostridium sp.]
MNFTKMHGIGNDFILIEDLNEQIKNESELAIKVCHRRFGIGADGLVLIRKSKECDLQMVIINSDGSRPNMCGNAIRCFGKYAYEKGLVKSEKFSVQTGDGRKDIELYIEDSVVKNVKVFMGQESLEGKDIPLADNLEKIINYKMEILNNEFEINTLLVGVPHTIVIDNKDKFETEFGANIEKNKIFKEGTNVNFVKINDRNNIIVRTWERGAGKTLACGTGACASARMLNILNLVDEKVNVTLPGGNLVIELEEEGIYMTGPAEYICKGEVL